MSTKNFSASHEVLPSGADMRIGVVVADWNSEVTSRLLQGAVDVLARQGASFVVRHVPGSFELTSGTQWMIQYEDVDAVICLGCVIQGETPHFTYICQSVSYGLTKLAIQYEDIPVIFGVVTTLNLDQALARAGGAVGNKGAEAAETAIRMVALHDSMEADADAADMEED